VSGRSVPCVARCIVCIPSSVYCPPGLRLAREPGFPLSRICEQCLLTSTRETAGSLTKTSCSRFPPSLKLRRTGGHDSLAKVRNSVTKAVISTLTAIAIKDGLLDSPNHRVLEFFDRRSIANVDDRKEATTVQSLLDMTLGLDWAEPLDGRRSRPIQRARNCSRTKFLMSQPRGRPKLARHRTNRFGVTLTFTTPSSQSITTWCPA